MTTPLPITTPTSKVGNTLQFYTKATDPLQRTVVTTATMLYNFYNPDKDPENNVSDRTPDYTFSVPFNSTINAYLILVPTVGWVPGTWTWEANATASDSSWTISEWAQVILNP